MTDLAVLARDVDHAARVVVTREWNEYVNRDVYAARVLYDDLLWLHCMHGHQTEDAAIRCARQRSKGMAARWRRARAADAAVSPSEGVVEWQWGHATRAGSVEFSRCRPAPVPDGVLVVDLGPASP